MGIFIQIVQFFLSLSILILLHELGHFLAARIFGVRVEKFYLFFNPWFTIFKRRIGQTEYGIGWLPLGGYCKIAGMVDESMDTGGLGQEPKPDEFRAQRAWKRLLIISGGVIVNLLLAWVIYASLLFAGGESYLATRDVRYGIVADSLAQELGFRNGDRIVAVNGDSIADYNEVLAQALLTPDARITFRRDGTSHDIIIGREHLAEIVSGTPLFGLRMPFLVSSVVPGSPAQAAGFAPGDSLLRLDGVPATFFDEFRTHVQHHRGDTVRVGVWRAGAEVELRVLVPESGVVGVQSLADVQRFFRVSRREYGPIQALGAGATLGINTLAKYLKSLKLLFVPEAKAHKTLGGFISIGRIFPERWNWYQFWSLTAFISLALAVMNFLPIPALDGGHALFIVYEMLTGRQPGPRFLVAAQLFGMLLLLILIVYANANDIIRLFQ